MNKVVEFRRGEIFDDGTSSMRNSLFPNDDRFHTNSSLGGNNIGESTNFAR